MRGGDRGRRLESPIGDSGVAGNTTRRREKRELWEMRERGGATGSD